MNRLLDEKDVENQTAPHILLASKDEDAVRVEKYRKIMGDNIEVTTYQNM